MRAFLYINDDELGMVEFKVINESIGGIGGELNPYNTYKNTNSRTLQQKRNSTY